MKDLVKDANLISTVEAGIRKNTRCKQRRSKCELLTLFRRAIYLTIFCIRQSKLHSIRRRQPGQTAAFTNHPPDDDEDKIDAGLCFDPSVFRANRQDRISEEVKKILARPPNQRSSQDLLSAQMMLRCIRAFVEYPVRMQRKIVEVGRFERYMGKRVIIRQGHPASSFYFILSGTVVVMVMDDDRKSTRPVAYLHRGQTFGELAIVHRGTRQSTIVAEGTVEFLTISVDDFHNIFMDGGVKNLHDPDHNSFLRGLDCLMDWPTQILVEHPQKCVFHFFKRGDLLVKDSHHSDWLIIVKSGSLTVVKKLQKVRPFQWQFIQTEDDKNCLSPDTIQELTSQRQNWRRAVLPELKIPLTTEDSKEDLICHVQFKHPVQNIRHASNKQHTNVYFPAIFQSKQYPKFKNKTKTKYGNDMTVLPKIRQNKLLKRTHGGNFSRNKENQSLDLSHRPIDESTFHTATVSDVMGPKSRVVNQEDEAEFHEHIRTINEDLDSARNQENYINNEKMNRTPEFVRVRTLTKGQVFGLAHLLFDQQPSLSVVSNGAECILIDKCLYWEHASDQLRRNLRQKGLAHLLFDQQPSLSVVSNGAECILIDKCLYWEHASDQLRRNLRQKISPFPSDDEMQSELQTNVDWEHFRQNTLKGAVQLAHSKRKSLVIG